MYNADMLHIIAKEGELRTAYADRTAELIRRRYDLNAELAILRQREEKPEEWAEYNAYAEECKAQAKREVYGEKIKAEG